MSEFASMPACSLSVPYRPVALRRPEPLFILFAFFLLALLICPQSALANPTVTQGSSATFAATGTDNPSGYWDIVRGTNSIATYSTTNGWSVSYNGGTNQFTVSAPASATVATGYEVRYYGSHSALFDVVALGPPQLSSLTLSAATIIGGNPVTATVSLTSAPTANTTITLASSVSSVASVPASVTVLAGSTSATFTITTTVVTASTSVTLTATMGTASLTASLTVVPSPNLLTFAVAPASLTGGNTASGTVQIDIAAPSGGVTVALASTNSAASVPASVTIGAGLTQGYFTITTIGVASSTSGNITATFNNVTKTQPLTVVPPQVSGLSLSPTSVTGGQNVTATLSLTGIAPPGGLSFNITCSPVQAIALPATIVVGGGQTSASSTLATSTTNYIVPVTLTASGSVGSASASVLLYPVNLRVLAILPLSTIRLTWDNSVPNGSLLKRSGTTIATLSSSAQTYDDSFAFTSGQTYLYQVTDPTGMVVYSATQAVPYLVPASDNQAVDSRIDPRYSTNVLLDHNFGATTYKGGLFAGYVGDPAKVGRSFARFVIPQVSAVGQTFRTGTVDAYFTGAQSAVSGLTIGCQALSNTSWSSSTLVWSQQPSFDPTQPTSTVNLTYDPNNPAPGWQFWTLGSAIKSAALAGQTLTAAWAATNESQNGWAYFAKREYNANEGPAVGYAFEVPLLLKVAFLNPGVLQITINGVGIGDSVSVTLSNSPLMPAYSQTVTVSGLTNTFVLDPSKYSRANQRKDAWGNCWCSATWFATVSYGGTTLSTTYTTPEVNCTGNGNCGP